MSNVIAQFHKGKYVNKPIQLGTTLAKDVILEDGDSVDAKFRRLKCNSNGELSFKGKNVVRSVNGVNADENGNVSLLSENATTLSEAITIDDNSSNNISLTTASEITVANGTTGKAWSKSVKITNSSSTITLGSSWTWVNGEVPTLSANSLLVLKWCYDFGVAGLVSITG